MLPFRLDSHAGVEDHSQLAGFHGWLRFAMLSSTVLHETLIQRRRGTPCFGEGNALGKQATRGLWAMDDRYATMILLDNHLVALADPGEHATDVAGEFGLGNANRRHRSEDSAPMGCLFSIDPLAVSVWDARRNRASGPGRPRCRYRSRARDADGAGSDPRCRSCDGCAASPAAP